VTDAAPEDRSVHRCDAFGVCSEPGAESLNEFTGHYFSEELDVAYDMTAEDGKLFARAPGSLKRLLVPTVRDAFASIGGPQVEFQRDADGKVAGFAMHAGGVRNVSFAR
jgi:hypothetical protein